MARKNEPYINEPYIYKVLRRETPNPRQQAFFRAEAANIAYGGCCCAGRCRSCAPTTSCRCSGSWRAMPRGAARSARSGSRTGRGS